MTPSDTDLKSERPLEALGIRQSEEDAYRWLLTHSGATVSSAARALTLTPTKSQRIFDALELMGMVTHTPERPRRYIAVSPDIAVEALLLKRQEKLQRARAVINELQQHAASQRYGEQEQLVEMITSREAERRIYEQLHLTAQREVVALTRPPLRVSQLELDAEVDHSMQRQAHARGVRYRSIVDASFLEMKGAVDRVQADLKSGENIRTLPELPLKMVLTDQRIAFVPLNLQPADRVSLLIRSSTLLDALYAMFNMLWERATPLIATGAGLSPQSRDEPRNDDDLGKLVSLMAAGLNDKAIAYELSLSPRTLNRRIADVLKSVDSRTRFQAGWQTALKLDGKTESTGDP